MKADDVSTVVELQKDAFPPPFDPDLLWSGDHLQRHIEVFPDGQFVVLIGDRIVGSCSNCLISEAAWEAHGSWNDTVGGPYLENHRSDGTTLYGLDVSVHPEVRRQGVGRAFYGKRFDLVIGQGLLRYGTACRIPDYRGYLEEHPSVNVREYVKVVVKGQAVDRTLTPLLRYGLRSLGVIENYMQDLESGNAAALLEWKP